MSKRPALSSPSPSSNKRVRRAYSSPLPLPSPNRARAAFSPGSLLGDPPLPLLDENRPFVSGQGELPVLELRASSNSASVASSDASHVDTGSVMSTSNYSIASEVPANEPELTKRFLTEGTKEIPRRVVTASIEAKVMTEYTLNPKSTVSKEEVLTEIQNNPLDSIVVTMGKSNMDANENILGMNVAKAEDSAKKHEKALQKVILDQQRNNGLLQQAKATLAEAQESWEAMNNKCESIRATREFHEEQLRLYNRKRALAQAFMEIIIHVASPDFKPFSQCPIEEVRRCLRLSSSKDVLDCLPSRGDCLRALHAMSVSGLVDNPIFRGYWKIPPEGSVGLTTWVEQYGQSPTVKTSKGNDSTHQLQTRVAHYLGLETPPLLTITVHQKMTDAEIASLRLRLDVIEAQNSCAEVDDGEGEDGDNAAVETGDNAGDVHAGDNTGDDDTGNNA